MLSTRQAFGLLNKRKRIIALKKIFTSDADTKKTTNINGFIGRTYNKPSITRPFDIIKATPHDFKFRENTPTIAEIFSLIAYLSCSPLFHSHLISSKIDENCLYRWFNHYCSPLSRRKRKVCIKNHWIAIFPRKSDSIRAV